MSSVERRCIQLIACVAFFFMFGVTYGNAGSISRQYVSPGLVEYPVREGIVISYQLDRAAKVTTTVMDSNHYLMKILEADRDVSQGTHSIIWDAKDEKGDPVPPGVYYFKVSAIFSDGSKQTYNPAYLGGAYEGIIHTTLSKENKELRFFLSDSSRVRIRAGIQRGPLKKTLVEWEPFAAGEHLIAWDGYDASGNSVVWDDPDFVISATGFTLPPHSIVIRGDHAFFDRYWQGRAAQSNMTLARYLVQSQDAIEAAHERRLVMENTLSHSVGAVSNFYFTNSFNNQPPQIDVYSGATKIVAQTLVEVASSTPLVIDFPEETKALFIDQRYEIIMYIDDRLVLEDETGYTPYSWVLDSKNLQKGEHVLTINIATLNDKVGAWSHTIIVK